MAQSIKHNPISVFDMFKIGVGPSSSHTVGPMIAANRFARSVISDQGIANQLTRLRIELYGSLALTGLGHATDTAIFCGLAGCLPDRTELDVLQSTLARLRETCTLQVAGVRSIPFDEKRDLVWLRNETLPAHPNAMQFTAYDSESKPLLTERFYSTGGGFVYNEQELAALKQQNASVQANSAETAPFPFSTAAELMNMARLKG